MDVSRYKCRTTATHVYFYGGPLSQWFKAPFRQRFVASGALYRFNCAEQYMMAAKASLFGDRAAFDAIMRASEPAAQKKLGRSVAGFSQTVWDDSISEILIRGNLGKFHQQPQLLEYLLSTGERRLVEGSPTDRIYGVGLSYDDPAIEDEAQWRGSNLLGNALQIVRTRFQTPI